MVSSSDFLADGTVAEGMATSLADVASEGVIDDPQAPETYGVGEGAPVIRFDVGQAQRGLTLGKTIEGARNGARDASAHQDVIRARQHCPVK